MSDKTEELLAEKDFVESEAKSHDIIDEDHDELYTLDRLTSVTAEDRRQANLDAYISLWTMLLRMEFDASTVGERRDEREEANQHGAADIQRLIDAGVFIPEAKSQVLGPKEYKLEWTRKKRTPNWSKSASVLDADLRRSAR